MNHDDTTHPTLIFVRGMPGSGKSYLSGALRQSFGQEKVVMLDPDAIDLQSKAYAEFTKTPYALEVDSKIRPFRYLKSQAFEGITAGKIMIWNQPFTDRGMFDRLVASLEDYAAERGISLRVLLVEIDIDREAAKERVRRRILEGGHGPSERTLFQRVHDYESYADNGLAIVTVRGDADAAGSVETVRGALRNLDI